MSDAGKFASEMRNKMRKEEKIIINMRVEMVCVCVCGGATVWHSIWVHCVKRVQSAEIKMRAALSHTSHICIRYTFMRRLLDSHTCRLSTCQILWSFIPFHLMPFSWNDLSHWWYRICVGVCVCVCTWTCAPPRENTLTSLAHGPVDEAQWGKKA